MAAIDIVEFEPDSESRIETPGPSWRTTPVRWAELLCVLLIVVLCNVTIYNGHGFAGYAVLFAVLPVLLYFGVARWASDASCRVIVPMLLVLAGRLIWCGDGLMVAVGFALLALVAMSFAGQRPYLLEAIVFVAQIVPAGFLANYQYVGTVARIRGPEQRRNWLAVVIPGAAFFVFSLLFLLANPDLLTRVSESLSEVFQQLRHWLIDIVPAPLQILFWIGVAWIAAGLIRPLAGIAASIADDIDPTPAPETSGPAPLYEAFRNTLAVVALLFGVYLVYEFTTVWSREFPPGSYSAYAHEGAFWLTVALAIATLMLSGIFQERMLSDGRLAVLRRWSRIWAVENFLLALAVYNRMSIYVDFNGMTRMRTVGLLGITAVVAGFILVLIKIARGRSFLWLIRRDLWALGFFIYLYAVLPVDQMVMGYNVRRILAGDSAASVQISVHPINTEGLRALIPLLQAEDDIIRDGVGAILAGELAELESDRARDLHWTEHQIADEKLHAGLLEQRSDLAPWADQETQRAAREAFDSYAYQWY